MKILIKNKVIKMEYKSKEYKHEELINILGNKVVHD